MTKALTMGPVMLDVEGYTLTSNEHDKIAHPNTGAIILFSRNIDTPEQVRDLIRQIRSARNGPVLIATDQEGGRVQRLKKGFTRLPPAACYARCDNDAAATLALSESAGWLMATELRSIDIDFSFAPILDIDCGISEIIGDRAFSQDPEQTTQFASAFRKGMNRGGMAAVGKHFPGHGAVALDSHLALPIDKRPLEAIRHKDLYPFRQLIAEGLEGIMPAHVVYSQIDPNPAGFSSFWIRQILRDEMGFQGAIFSDDLSMAGAASIGTFRQRAEAALTAGCDMVLVCNQPEAAEIVLDTLPVAPNPEREQRLFKMPGKQGMDYSLMTKSQEWQDTSYQISKITEGLA
ncbi:MAG: beta-N-acetylhexosaminidase [Methylococcaceae bacterium]